ncbi:MAG: ribulose-phosphate 3-epimerase [Clostridiaceae bacterium]|nr:ribulose-phosphate 3-epimerase [Clostridiaceae bacterium]
MAVKRSRSLEDTKRAVFLDRSRPLLCPSILASDLADLACSVKRLGSNFDMVHCDVMDGHYVPNLTFGPPIIAALSKHVDQPLDVHLMVTNPDDLLAEYVKAGATSLVVHVEVLDHAQRTLARIRELGCFAGISLNPATPLESIRWLLPDLDMVLLMSVNPGFSGQSFVPQVMDKIRELRHMINESDYSIRLQVDGGINRDNAADIVRAGADMIVAGSAIFGQDSPADAAAELGRIIRGAKARL